MWDYVKMFNIKVFIRCTNHELLLVVRIDATDALLASGLSKIIKKELIKMLDCS